MTNLKPFVQPLSNILKAIKNYPNTSATFLPISAGESTT